MNISFTRLDILFCIVLKHVSALEALRNALYKFSTYLLTSYHTPHMNEPWLIGCKPFDFSLCVLQTCAQSLSEETIIVNCRNTCHILIKLSTVVYAVLQLTRITCLCSPSGINWYRQRIVTLKLAESDDGLRQYLKFYKIYATECILIP